MNPGKQSCLMYTMLNVAQLYQDNTRLTPAVNCKLAWANFPEQENCPCLVSVRFCLRLGRDFLKRKTTSCCLFRSAQWGCQHHSMTERRGLWCSNGLCFLSISNPWFSRWLRRTALSVKHLTLHESLMRWRDSPHVTLIEHYGLFLGDTHG